MNDPWNVKSVRQSGQYISCMKINGVPLLPPVLSNECRKEMQYYKLLAKEVEKRILLLQHYTSDASFDSEDVTEAPELPEYEQCYEMSQGNMQAEFSNPQTSSQRSPKCINDVNSNILKSESPVPNDPKFSLDLSLKVNQPEINVGQNKIHSPPLRDLPERDYNCISKVTKEKTQEKDIILALDDEYNKINNLDSCDITINNPFLSDPFSEILIFQEGPSSLSSKSFTGSLNDIHSESIKDSQIESSKLVRQSSYTLLQPGPQLLAHLEIQAQSKGIAMNSISMSDSLSDINTAIRKRKGWDLETAKEKWSKMALELKQKNVFHTVIRTNVCKTIAKSAQKKINQSRARSSVPPPPRRSNLNGTNLPKSDPLPKSKRSISPVRKYNNSYITPTQSSSNNSSSPNVPPPMTESEDPATRVRELYEKIQNQQLVQMASLVEKQKKEQMLLQQVFEEQNNLLFKQLKNICPKSPVEPKDAWADKLCDSDRGPVSLSQLINYKSPEQSSYSNSISSTLTETNNYINHCDNVLKKSRDITGSKKKEQYMSRSLNGTKIQSSRTQLDGSITRTHSPVRSNTASRKLNYDTSASSDQNEPILTDRTNDTMADLNVTFPSDPSDENKSKNKNSNSVLSHVSGRHIISNPGYNAQNTLKPKSLEINSKNVELSSHNTHSTQNSIFTHNRGFGGSTKTPVFKNVATPQERAAATKIVAFVKGYLVRRLMRTERVQGTVQTIKDALLCALQLHQDREGIRGADVDLHRRLIQQITAACYSLHDTFVASTPAERCAMIAADRGRRRSLAARQPNHSYKQTDIMSQSHSGSFPARSKRAQPLLMTQSNYETFSGDKSAPVSRRYVSSPHRRPWR